ncbi:MAG: VCBS domain-containing protein, partial [Planctomycetaceae bacterium]|nr:VCBS domain-containing protein [Planctomycetaceae bacterium]
MNVSAHDILSAEHGDWYEQASALSGGNTTDIFSFTLTRATGVFVDIDARDIGLSSFDSIVTLFENGSTQVATNDDGYDFEGIDPADGLSLDSSLYADLAAGNYEVRVTGFGGSVGSYLMRMLFDTSYTATVPVLNSLPGASSSLFLDFDGHSGTDSWGTYTALPFNFGGGLANTFSPGERLAIRNSWSVTSEDYSPFDINVTTVQPSVINDRVAQRLAITESNGSIVGVGGSLGVAFLNSFAFGGVNNQTSWVFASSFSTFGASSGLSGRIMATAIEIGNTTSHEIGHALGLEHWATQSGAANGATIFPNGIMSTPDQGLNREIWQSGVRAEDGSPQEDVVVIANATNGFGFRTDDHGGTLMTATVLTLNGVTYTSAGVISQYSDLDLFQFVASSTTTIKVDVNEYVNDLDVQIRLLDNLGNPVSVSDPSGSFDANLTVNLATGTYYLEVTTDGEHGELGQYSVSITTTAFTTTPPTAQDDDLSGSEDVSVTANLLADNGHGVDTDPETPNSLTIVAINGSTITNGQVITLVSGAELTVNSNGSVEYDPNGQFESLNVGQQAADSFTYTISDPGGLQSTATVAVTISGVNDAPVATANSESTTEDASTSGNVLNEGTPDSDVDNAANTLVVSRVNGQTTNVGSQIT